MKWITHQTGAVLGAFALGLPLPGIACSCLGAVFPDVIDQRVSRLASDKRSRQKNFNRIHRGASHWFGWWLLLFIATLTVPVPLFLRDALSGFCLGALSHVGMDLLTPRGVPIMPFTHIGKIALPICSTGKAGEYIFLTLIICAGIFWFWDSLRA